MKKFMICVFHISRRVGAEGGKPFGFEWISMSTVASHPAFQNKLGSRFPSLQRNATQTYQVSCTACVTGLV